MIEVLNLLVMYDNQMVLQKPDIKIFNMIAKIIYKSGVKVIIEWNDKDESGQISIVYDEKGRYIVNAEYIDIDRLLEILNKIKL